MAKIEIEEEALHVEVERAAEELITYMLQLSQEAEIKRKALNGNSNGDTETKGDPFDNLVAMIGLEPLNKNERVSLYALLSWVSQTQQVSLDTVVALFRAKFGVNDVMDVQRMHFQHAVAFLVDLKVKEKVA